MCYISFILKAMQIYNLSHFVITLSPFITVLPTDYFYQQ